VVLFTNVFRLSDLGSGRKQPFFHGKFCVHTSFWRTIEFFKRESGLAMGYGYNLMPTAHLWYPCFSDICSNLGPSTAPVLRKPSQTHVSPSWAASEWLLHQYNLTRPLRPKGPRLFALQKSSKMSIQIPSIERTELWKPWPNSSMIHRWKMVVFHSNCYQRVWKEAVAADVNRHNGVGLKHQRRIAIASPVYPRVKPGSEKGYPKLCYICYIWQPQKRLRFYSILFGGYLWCCC